jgi:dihydroorotase
MDILLKEVKIIHKQSTFHGQKVDILLSDGIIKQINQKIDAKVSRLIAGKNLHCCIGLCDIGTHSGEPGYEHRETMASLTQSALAGGYTALATFPDTKPVIQSKGDIHFLKNHKDRNGVSIYPIGALSKDNKGLDIAEYLDMKEAGAVAVSQGNTSVDDTGLLSRAMQYALHACLPVIHHPDDNFLSVGGQMHEGATSTILGLKGLPSIAEVHSLQRDILLCEYNDSLTIEHAISCRQSVEIMKKAKKAQNKVSCTVPYLNLIFDDSTLDDFDTNFKVTPPLRAKEDQKALIKGLKDGTIDAIISNHTPIDDENKNVEFPYATPGAIGLETCLSACLTYLLKEIELEVLIEKLTWMPRNLLHVPIPMIEQGAKADLCVFDLDETWTVQLDTQKSKSKNNPFIGKTLRGKIVYTFV